MFKKLNSVLFLLFYVLINSSIAADGEKWYYLPDSLFYLVEKPLKSVSTDHLRKDSVFWINEETNFDTITYIEPVIINKIQNYTQKFRLTRQLADQFFTNQNVKDIQVVDKQEKFFRYQDREIDNIQIIHSDILHQGQDSLGLNLIKKMTQRINKAHNYTQEGIIRKYLLIKTGQTVNPALLHENERLIRDLSFIEECKFLLSPSLANPEKVDIIVLIKDRISWNVELKLNNDHHAMISSNLLNVYGSGNGLNEQININMAEINKTVIFHSQLNLYNLGGYFINSHFLDHDDGSLRYKKIVMSRPLSSDIFTYTGGLTLADFNKTILDNNEQLEYKDYDFWFGRAMSIKSINEALGTPRMILSGRYYQRLMSTSPFTEFEDLGAVYQHRDAIVNFAISKRHYYYGKYIYDLGKREDLPAGYLINGSIGQKTWADSSMLYQSFQFSFGKFRNKIGYIYQNFQISSWYLNSQSVNAMIKYEYFRFSQLYHLFGMTARSFWHLNYTLGINRQDETRLYLEDPLLPGSLTSSGESGTKRLLVSWENVVYRGISNNGLQSGYYFHADMALLAEDSEKIFQQKIIWGSAAGWRVKHRSLALNTLQIEVSALWREAGRYPIMAYSIAANRRISFNNFINIKPYFMEFQ